MDQYPGLPRRPWISRSLTANVYVGHSSLRRWLNDELGPFRTDALAAIILRAIMRNGGGIATSTLAARYALPRSTLATAIARLEARQLARRYRSPGDRRYRVVELTATGRREAELVGPAIDRIEHQATQAAGPDLLSAFNRIVAYIAAADDERTPASW